jgi:thiol-disulfide isomerase/thioredoxin
MLKRRTVLAAGAGVALGMSAWGQHRVSAWQGPDPMPWLEGEDQNGVFHALREARGKPVLVNFWATWCTPCLDELPSLQALQAAGQGQWAVWYVNVKETPKRVQRHLGQTGMNISSLMDRRGEWVRQLGISILPTTLLISAQGKIIASVTGEVNWMGPEARQWLEDLKQSRSTLTPFP